MAAFARLLQDKAIALPRRHGHYLLNPSLTDDANAQLLSLVQVVLVQRIFGTHRTTGGAVAAIGATRAIRLFGCACITTKMNGLGDGAKRVLNPQAFGCLLQPGILLTAPRVDGHAQHVLGRLKVRCQLLAPISIGQLLPGRVVIKPLLRLQQHGGVNDAATAYANAAHEADVPEKILRKKTIQSQGWLPQQFGGLLRRLFHVLRLNPSTLLDDGHAQALLGRTQRCHRTAKPTANDRNIEIHDRGGSGSVVVQALDHVLITIQHHLALDLHRRGQFTRLDGQ